jgi:ketose-bisphosphate aldolase
MPLVSCAELVKHACKNRYAVAQVNTNGATYGLVRAIAEVAQEERAPIILGDYEKNMAYCGFGYAAMVMRHFAEQLDVPVAVHLDHGSTVESCEMAIRAGFNSVMIDGSHLPIGENIAQTKKVLSLARPRGITVEAEVGELQKLNPDGSMDEVQNLTDPRDVARISTETDIDMLAVGIGNAHGFYKGQPNIRIDLLEKLAAASKVPLVLHGTTGLADEVVERCVSMGMAKVNLGTLIRTRYVEYTAAVIAEGKHQNHPWRVCQAVKDRIKDHVRHIVRVTGSAGRARDFA